MTGWTGPSRRRARSARLSAALTLRLGGRAAKTSARSFIVSPPVVLLGGRVGGRASARRDRSRSTTRADPGLGAGRRDSHASAALLAGGSWRAKRAGGRSRRALRLGGLDRLAHVGFGFPGRELSQALVDEFQRLSLPRRLEEARDRQPPRNHPEMASARHDEAAHDSQRFI